MANKTEWALMTYREVERASKEGRTVLVPTGTVETQGKHTAIGFEHILPYRIALAAAEQTNAVVTPVIPFGWSADFEEHAGTISVRPETLAALYEDVFRAILSHGFDHVLVLATHIPNQQMIETSAYKLRREFGVWIAWVNPGQLANRVLQELDPNAAKTQGHGAEPGISLGEFLAPGSTDFSDMKPNITLPDFNGFPLTRMAPNFQGFPIGVPMMLRDTSPESSGAGDPTSGNAELGQRIFDGLVNYTVELVKTFQKADTRSR